jgi:hypothetical protein
VYRNYFRRGNPDRGSEIANMKLVQTNNKK